MADDCEETQFDGAVGVDHDYRAPECLGERQGMHDTCLPGLSPTRRFLQAALEDLAAMLIGDGCCPVCAAICNDEHLAAVSKVLAHAGQGLGDHGLFVMGGDQDQESPTHRWLLRPHSPVAE